MIGVLSAWFKTIRPEIWLRKRIPIVFVGVLVLLVSGVVFFANDLDHNWFARTFLFTTVSIGFAALLPQCNSVLSFQRRCTNLFFKNVALWSYSMYLRNLLVFTLTMKAIGNRLGTNFFLDIFVLLTAVLICVVLSYVVYRYFEPLILRFRDRFVEKKALT